MKMPVLMLGVLLLSAAVAAAPAPPLQKTQSYRASLKAGASQDFQLKLQAGDYVEGRLQATQSLTLDVLDGRGRRWRRLLEAVQGDHDFRFVAEQPGLSLRLQAGAADGAYHLQLLQQWSRSEQKAEAPVPASPWLAAWASRLGAGADSQRFWEEVARRGSPLVEDVADGQKRLTFLYRGAQRNVWLFGAPVPDHEPLQRLGDSDVWFRSYVVPADTRMAYQLAPDVPSLPGSSFQQRMALRATSQRDPLNHHPWPASAGDRFTQESSVTLVAARSVWQGLPSAKAGQLQTLTFNSRLLGNSRALTLYQPAGFRAGQADTVLLVLFDAHEYLAPGPRGKVPTPEILDRLIAAGRLPPVQAVFVANPDAASRARELPDNPLFAQALAEEMLPWLQQQGMQLPPPARRVLAGSSYGGLAAATVALRYPQVFGNVLSLSGSFWWSPAGTPAAQGEYVAHWLASKPVLPLRFHLAAGLFEGSRQGEVGILETNRHLRDVLQARGYRVSYQEFAGGHDYFAWQQALPEGLLALFGKSTP